MGAWECRAYDRAGIVLPDESVRILFSKLDGVLKHNSELSVCFLGSVWADSEV
jgi:hypothetical protein